MTFCIDSSALVDLGERHYPERLPVFAPIWSHLYKEIESGNLITIDYVKTELEQKADDWRTEFITRAGAMFHISEAIEAEYASVILEIETNQKFSNNSARSRFMKGADPWLIALARNGGNCSVISAETKPLAAYGIGAVCNVLGVKHMNLVEFFEAIKVGK